MKIIVRRTAGIGDSLAATVVADLLHEQGHEVVWQTHPEIIPIIKRHPTIVRVEPPKGHCDVNLDGAYENPWNQSMHFHNAFILRAKEDLKRIGVSISLNHPQKPPRLMNNEVNIPALKISLDGFDRPWVMVVPRSMFQTRCVPDSVWRDAIPLFDGSVFWMGQHPAPIGKSLKSLTVGLLCDYLNAADLVVTVDTGPMHIASAYGIPMVVISQSHDVHLRLSPLSDFEVIRRDDLACLNCQKHRCPIDPYNPPCGQINPVKLADVVNRKLNSVFKLTQIATKC